MVKRKHEATVSHPEEVNLIDTSKSLLENLPLHIWAEISPYLAPQDIIHLEQTRKYFKEFSNHENKGTGLWQSQISRLLLPSTKIKRHVSKLTFFQLTSQLNHVTDALMEIFLNQYDCPLFLNIIKATDFSPLVIAKKMIKKLNDCLQDKEKTLLHYFATTGNFIVIVYLTEQGFNIHAQDEENLTPLHLLFKYNQPFDVQSLNKLLELKADLTLVCNDKTYLNLSDNYRLVIAETVYQYHKNNVQKHVPMLSKMKSTLANLPKSKPEIMDIYRHDKMSAIQKISWIEKFFQEENIQSHSLADYLEKITTLIHIQKQINLWVHQLIKPEAASKNVKHSPRN